MKAFFNGLFLVCLVILQVSNAESSARESSVANVANDDLYQVIKEKSNAILAKNGKFVSISGGVNMFSIANNKFNFIPTIGIRGGIYSFFTPYIGVRGFFGFDLGLWKHSTIVAIISLGIDAIAEFPLSKSKKTFLGGMLGFGGDAYVYYDDVTHNNFSNMQKKGEIFMQGGITFAFYKPNRINILYRFLPVRKTSDFNPAGLVVVEYSYKF
ncbi:hypothetical protein [Helicobacter fennelliae]|uniref:Outer membrane protein n=2 Tax=Helicobacter fennelliae TaxID=215 RepID=A0A2X3BB01_9HELI|nr:hypothetical protein [Helicobacter fennelliae]GAD18144.1 putative outer membrane protein [Helicobacter fennelliae MRY12-0050]SQB98051.1 outer membrane protein [Helicobacter fennelliae]STP06738.1 outer membrane protein [Helicobacter fennelliae]